MLGFNTQIQTYVVWGTRYDAEVVKLLELDTGWTISEEFIRLTKTRKDVCTVLVRVVCTDKKLKPIFPGLIPKRR